MDATDVLLVAISIALAALVRPFFRALNWLWLEPKKLEKYLKEQVSAMVRYIPTKANKRMKQVCEELQDLLSGIITKRGKALETEVSNTNSDLLGILMKSNSEEIKAQGVGLSIQEDMVRYIPTKANRRMKQVCKELQALLSGIITKREKAMETEVDNDDLLGILMKSNSKEIKEQGIGLSIQEAN
ncbi:hypothetical protein AG4045_003474 [Apium graveolens]|uniref:Uncharacterized protein n=1 Tax=Apium graveolens TaxID=4045 RepID=A0A6L5B915_APIGR|nr:hypothetical protein AG4045_003474 [Apium graveolens]